MKDRIRQIMENEQLTSAKFADKLQLNRAVISHILTGRNNASLDVVTKILSEMNYINPEWLLTGNGNMYKDGFEIENVKIEPDLFTQRDEREINEPEITSKLEKEVAEPVKLPNKTMQQVEYKEIDLEKKEDKKITQIIIYYSNGTFETFRGN